MSSSSGLNIQIEEVLDSDQLSEIRSLFLDYAHSLSYDLCFQDFDNEVKELPGMYAPGEGCLLLARSETVAVGCIGLRKLEVSFCKNQSANQNRSGEGSSVCEMKRLYVRPQYRGLGVGQALVEAVLGAARSKGYAQIYLDTMPDMIAAISMYRKFGFTEIAQYCENPVAGAVFLGLDLLSAQPG